MTKIALSKSTAISSALAKGMLWLIMIVAFGGCGNRDSSFTAEKELDVEPVVYESANDKSGQTISSGTDVVKEDSSALIIGLDADMSSGSAKSGEAIRRGIVLAIKEINQNGGLLGRPLRLVVRDHRGNPDRGVDNLIDFSEMPNLLAVIGGIHTPVALKELSTIHDRDILYLGPWAAGTLVVENGYEPNNVFRVSVRDEYAGGFLVEKAIDRNLTKMGLLLERTGWGRSNERAITDALDKRNIEPVKIEWFNWGEKTMDAQVSSIVDAGADVVLLVSNPLEGAELIKTMGGLDESRRIPIISHWGISAGNFFEESGSALELVDLTFLQSYSFLSSNINEKSRRLVNSYLQHFEDSETARDIYSPVGTAHAFELVTMLAQAVEQAESIDVDEVRHALEDLDHFSGVIRDYTYPFSRKHHDALNVDDFILARFDSDGVIVPLGHK